MKKPPKARQLLSYGPDVASFLRRAGEVIARTGPEYNERWNDLVVLIATTEMDGAAKAKMIALIVELGALRLEQLNAEWIYRDIAKLTISEASELIQGRKRINGGRKIGDKRKKKASEAHEEWASDATRMIEVGTAPREVSGKLAIRHKVSAMAVRAALQDAGVLPPRKKRN